MYHRLDGSPSAIALSIGKWQISTPEGAQTPQPILTKLDIVDYVRDPTLHDNFGGSSSTWVAWAHT